MSSSSIQSTRNVLTLATFRAWLLSKHPRSSAGQTSESDACPLAKFLTQTTGVPHVIGLDGYQRAQTDADGKPIRGYLDDYEYEPTVALPQWAQDFVEQVDRRFLDRNHDAISVSAALRIAESSTLGRAARMVG